MRPLLRALLYIFGALFLFAAAFLLWMKTLAKDDGATGRPNYGTFTWTAPVLGAANNGAGEVGKIIAPRAGPIPRADGYVMGSLGNDFILPPMPPERQWDIHRANSVYANSQLKTCFWPGPKLRPGFYTTDPDDYGIENQLPDTMNTFSTAWFNIPEGAEIIVKGDFPHMRHWSFTTYSEDGVPRDVINDVDINPDAGSSNPFRRGVARDISPRRYTFSIVNGEPPTPRPANKVYTRMPAGSNVGMHMRNYVPDKSIDYLGGAGVPEVELLTKDGKTLKGEEACTATNAPLRGKQVPLTVPKNLWLALNSMPWRHGDKTPAENFEVSPMEVFFNREYLILKTFFPVIASDSMAIHKGGFWSNISTRYGYKYISQAYGKVYVVQGKMPTTPQTWSGDAKPVDTSAQMRYWSMCTVNAPPTGNTVDCLFDEAVRPTVDARGNYTVVVSRAPDRPSNATEKCGVAWMEWGTGDGIPGGSKDYGGIMNRHTLVNPDFTQSWFSVNKPGSEREMMGDYLPQTINFHEKERFEALGCPVDTTKINAMIKH